MLKVMQDGGDFWGLYTGMDRWVLLKRYDNVSDGDMKAASHARELFEDWMRLRREHFNYI